MSHSPAIRRAAAADARAIAALLDRLDEMLIAALPWLLREPEGVTPVAFVEEFLTRPDHTAFVAEETELVGALLLYIRQPTQVPVLRPGRVAEIEALVVAEPHHRRGIGRALVQAATIWAGHQGAARVELGVYEVNDGARAFWDAVGFETLSRRMCLRLQAEESGAGSLRR